MDINTMTIEQLKNELKVRRSQEKQQKQAGNLGDGLHAKVSAKGGVSVYGLGRYPVTLYGKQWARLLSKAAPLADFIVANDSKLTHKVDAVEEMTETPSAEPATV